MKIREIEIEIGGKSQVLTFNKMAVNIFLLTLAEKGNPVAISVYAMFYAGLCATCTVNGEKEDFSWKDVCNWLDELYDSGKEDDIKKVDAFFIESEAYKNFIKEHSPKLRSSIATEGKKKVKVK